MKRHTSSSENKNEFNISSLLIIIGEAWKFFHIFFFFFAHIHLDASIK